MAIAMIFLLEGRVGSVMSTRDPVRLGGGDRCYTNRLRPKAGGGGKGVGSSKIRGLGDVEGIEEDRVEDEVQYACWR